MNEPARLQEFRLLFAYISGILVTSTLSIDLLESLSPVHD